jgi:hypothetical protein
VIEADFSIWKSLAWKINFPLQGSFYMSYNGYGVRVLAPFSLKIILNLTP